MLHEHKNLSERFSETQNSVQNQGCTQRHVRTFPRMGARFSEVCTQSVHVFLRSYHYYILEGAWRKSRVHSFRSDPRLVHTMKP